MEQMWGFFGWGGGGRQAPFHSSLNNDFGFQNSLSINSLCIFATTLKLCSVNLLDFILSSGCEKWIHPDPGTFFLTRLYIDFKKMSESRWLYFAQPLDEIKWIKFNKYIFQCMMRRWNIYLVSQSWPSKRKWAATKMGLTLLLERTKNPQQSYKCRETLRIEKKKSRSFTIIIWEIKLWKWPGRTCCCDYRLHCLQHRLHLAPEAAPVKHISLMVVCHTANNLWQWTHTKFLAEPITWTMRKVVSIEYMKRKKSD